MTNNYCSLIRIYLSYMKLMRSETGRINVANSTMFLALRKEQSVANALKVINVFKTGGKE